MKNNDTGDIACDSYNKYMEDVKLLEALKVRLPGLIAHVLQKGVQVI